jgi:hypothetical protein
VVKIRRLAQPRWCFRLSSLRMLRRAPELSSR